MIKDLSNKNFHLPLSPARFLQSFTVALTVLLSLSCQFLDAAAQKQYWTQPQKVSTYAAALNSAFIKLRRKPDKKTLLKICGENGLCHSKHACKHRAALSFFWLLCRKAVPGFAQLPCVKQNAQHLSFNPSSGLFELTNTYTPLEYLETYLFSRHTPRYMEFIMAKIITQGPQDILPISAKLKSQSCSKYRKMCTYTAPVLLDDDGSFD